MSGALWDPRGNQPALLGRLLTPARASDGHDSSEEIDPDSKAPVTLPRE
jgi:hypothetical protein